MIPRPDLSEHAEYYGLYIGQIPDGDIVEMLEAQIDETERLLAAVPPEGETLPYAPGKWSLREVIGHLIDTERVFAFRCLQMARRDPAPLPGMDQELWSQHSNAAGRTLADLMAELRAVRTANVQFFSSLDPAVYLQRGTASGFQFSVRAFPWIVAGHHRHHLNLIIERYLPALETG